MIDGLDHLVRFRSVDDWLPGLLREGLPVGIPVMSRLRDGQSYPFVLVKEVPLVGAPPVDRDFVYAADVEVHAFAAGLDAQYDARDLASACESLLASFGRDGRIVGPSEKVAVVRITECAARRTDWSDADSTVQYQDLPVGVERFRVQARVLVTRRNWVEVGKG